MLSVLPSLTAIISNQEVIAGRGYTEGLAHVVGFVSQRNDDADRLIRQPTLVAESSGRSGVRWRARTTARRSSSTRTSRTDIRNRDVPAASATMTGIPLSIVGFRAAGEILMPRTRRAARDRLAVTLGTKQSRLHRGLRSPNVVGSGPWIARRYRQNEACANIGRKPTSRGETRRQRRQPVGRWRDKQPVRGG